MRIITVYTAKSILCATLTAFDRVDLGICCKVALCVSLLIPYAKPVLVLEVPSVHLHLLNQSLQLIVRPHRAFWGDFVTWRPISSFLRRPISPNAFPEYAQAKMKKRRRV
ncbi:hypothetical protein XELAEV_18023828mg [Xenopus laevis]|uniref:Uncharacterized protein n=1 Tax=Xenopus laevis TaxID=8355 RepID=A0A974D7F2_XENLA|nr:hypothetical protein XELAEV_18023828mg [Xenopus laevis]